MVRSRTGLQIATWHHYDTRRLSRRSGEGCTLEQSNTCSMYTSTEFQRVRQALVACSDADRAYLRRWILRWVDERGRILREAEPLPDRGCTKDERL